MQSLAGRIREGGKGKGTLKSERSEKEKVPKNEEEQEVWEKEERGLSLHHCPGERFL